MRVMVAIGGHRFDRDAFDALLASLADATCEVVKHPEAARRMNPAGLVGFDALLLYDLPGIDFGERAGAPRLLAPTAEFVAGFEALLEAGVGIVALHHALAGWPAWPRYAEILGGAFLYVDGMIRGQQCTDSGFAPDVEYRAQMVTCDHPVVAGLPTQFALRDELYLAEVFEHESTPLLRADASFEARKFQSAAAALRRAPSAESTWQRRDGSSTIAWARHTRRSRIVYIQPGDCAPTLRDPHYQRLVANGLSWVARRS